MAADRMQSHINSLKEKLCSDFQRNADLKESHRQAIEVLNFKLSNLTEDLEKMTETLKRTEESKASAVEETVRLKELMSAKDAEVQVLKVKTAELEMENKTLTDDLKVKESEIKYFQRKVEAGQEQEQALTNRIQMLEKPAEVSHSTFEKDLGEILDELDQIAKLEEENKKTMERQSRENQELKTKLESKEAELQRVKSQLEARELQNQGLVRRIENLEVKVRHKTTTDLRQSKMAAIMRRAQEFFKAKVDHMVRRLKSSDAVNASLVKELAQYEKNDTEEVNAEEVDTEEVDAEEVDAEKIDTWEVDAEEADAVEVDAEEVDAEKIDTWEIDTWEIDTWELDTWEIDTWELDAEFRRR